MAADRARRRAPGVDDGRDRNALAGFAPVLGLGEDVFIGGQHRIYLTLTRRAAAKASDRRGPMNLRGPAPPQARASSEDYGSAGTRRQTAGWHEYRRPWLRNPHSAAAD